MGNTCRNVLFMTGNKYNSAVFYEWRILLEVSGNGAF